ncbi:hypothetical protein LZ31DRAFT_146072 [Colletotrichum somersetense]|nr:hypothetical protein LZ31DRAFT_146072 [Colletotrichum somersetense]
MPLSLLCSLVHSSLAGQAAKGPGMVTFHSRSRKSVPTLTMPFPPFVSFLQTRMQEHRSLTHSRVWSGPDMDLIPHHTLDATAYYWGRTWHVNHHLTPPFTFKGWLAG